MFYELFLSRIHVYVAESNTIKLKGGGGVKPRTEWN